MDKLRITFKKGWQVKYISHLDLLRTFIRAIRRAQIPVKYSEGFNPHAQLTFAMPLAVGVTSDGEVLDIGLEERIDIVDAIKNLERALPAGLQLVEAQVTPSKMPEFSKAAYTITVENESELNQEIVDKILKAMRSGDIIVEKKTKKKTTMVNIIEHIYAFEVIQFEGKKIVFQMTLSAGNEFTLKPELVLIGIQSMVDELSPIDIDVHRREILI